MTSALIGWRDEEDDEHRRRMRTAMWISLAVHIGVVVVFASAPNPPRIRRPTSISVELVVAPRVASAMVPPSKPAALTAKPAPRATPAVQPAPAPPPPVMKAPVQILPEEVPGRVRKVPAPPKFIAERKPKPAPPAVIWRPEREPVLDYRDAMAALGDELGVDETAGLLTPAPLDRKDRTAATSTDTSPTRPGPVRTSELAAWNRATQRLIQSKWVTPVSDRGRGLATSLELRLAASGALIGPPRVVGSSGDPFFDDNAVRALLTVAPLPPVAEPGIRIFVFRSEQN